MRFLLRPGWLGLTAAVVVFAVACFTVLAPWQFRRHDERQARNRAIEASFHTDPVPIDAIPVDAAGGREWRQVTLTGSYLPEAEAVARLRSVQGEPAFEVLTPLRLDSDANGDANGDPNSGRDTGDVVLVDRGFVRPLRGATAGRGVQVPEFEPPPAGRVTLVGRLRNDESNGQGRGAITDGGHRQVYAIDAAAVGQAAGLPIRPGYVQLNADQPGVLGAMPLPRLDAGPHLAYALQWLAFGVMALIGWLLLMRRELAERALGPAPAGPGPAAVAVSTPVAADERGEHG